MPRAQIVFALFSLLLKVCVVIGDTPANCTYDDILGDWVFHIGEDGYDRKLNCTGFGNGKSKSFVLWGLCLIHVPRNYKSNQLNR